ncbi:hypothetical protein CSIV_12255 [Microbacterium sp. CSI-V]|uniref:hypothetical protein n=1 Tax=unclassified Microbacterium TaxID=2609290 RepID=UPI00097C298C|nr:MULTISPECIES: hypothetical protein [unclassified Microbacterium]MXS73650.1 hypothetical protein [Microbacterium sp. TL13]ONI62286.1 hypothetical protein CSIV_12255 [Microbacterium sp. CSI-V]
MTSTATRPRKESPSARAARKNRLLTWITLAIAAVICAVIGVGAYAMNTSWWTEESPVAASDQQLPDGQSRFDQAGQDFFNRQGRVTVDLSSTTSASDLGLPLAGTTAVDTLVPLSLDIRTGGEDIAFGGVSHFEITTGQDRVTRISVEPASSGSWSAISADLRSRATAWGWTDADLATLGDQVGDAGRREGVASTVSLPAVASEGLGITADVNVTAGGSLQLVYTLTR